MAVQKEIWENFIAENLFEEHEWLKLPFDADEFVLMGKVVHIPQAAPAVGAEKNRSSYPIAVVKRADTDVTYGIDEYSTGVINIPNADTIELSYDKVASVLGDHMGVLKELFAAWLQYEYSPTLASSQTRTSGGAVAAHLASATGNRAKFVKEDLKKARLIMNKQKVSKMNRYAIIDSDMMDQLLDDDDLKVRDSSGELDIRNGVIMKLYGFKLIEVVNPFVYDNAATPAPKDPDSVAAATDNAAVLCFQAMHLERATGEIKFFEDLDNPQYQGDLYSALVRVGGRKRRADEKGVVSIIQAAA